MFTLFSKLSPSTDVNKNSKIYFLIQWKSGQDVHMGKKIVKVCCLIKKSRPLNLYDNK